MFRRLPEAAVGAVTIAVDGASVAARAGDTVAAALLASGIWAFRTSGVSGTARGPYCMMGVCFDCLVAIDGIGSRQACLVPAREGMRIETQRGRRAVGP
jgi:predicted molibdopterin-dependent oxidoreductase YjgC